MFLYCKLQVESLWIGNGFFTFLELSRERKAKYIWGHAFVKNGLGPPVKNYLHNLNSDFCTSGKKKQLVGIRGTIIKDWWLIKVVSSSQLLVSWIHYGWSCQLINHLKKVYVVGDLVSPNMMLNWESLAKLIKSGSTKSTLNNYPCF